MSHLRAIALSAVLVALPAMIISSATQADAVDRKIDVTPVSGTWTLVEADWCESLCATKCDTCVTARIQGCTCYWLCENGDEGSQICTGAVGVRICS